MEYSSRRSFLAKLSALALAARTRSWASEPGGLLFAGTYTKDKGQHQPGDLCVSLGCGRGHAGAPRAGGRYRNPSFLTFSPDRRHLYAVNEVDEYHAEKSGSVTSFAVEGASGRLKAINTVSSGGGMPCKITVDFTGKAAFVANYDGGSAASFRVLKSGALSKPVSRFQYSGHGANPAAPGRSSYRTAPPYPWTIAMCW